MSLTKVSRSKLATAASQVEGGRSSRYARFLDARLAGLSLVMMMMLGACSDMPTAPSNAGVGATGGAYVMPAVLDARLRLTEGLKDLPTRQRVILDLSNLEIALRRGDGAEARRFLTQMETTLADYTARPVSTELADISGIRLALNAVQSLVDPNNPLRP